MNDTPHYCGELGDAGDLAELPDNKPPSNSVSCYRNPVITSPDIDQALLEVLWDRSPTELRTHWARKFYGATANIGDTWEEFTCGLDAADHARLSRALTDWFVRECLEEQANADET